MESKSREAFEAWFEPRLAAMKDKRISLIRIYQIKNREWQSWQASRAALVVKLPSKITEVNRLHSGHVLPEVAAYDEAIDDCADSIRAAGIIVKGEGDEG